MDSNRRTFLALTLGGAVLWTLGSADAADTAPATPIANVVQLTLNVEGMH